MMKVFVVLIAILAVSFMGCSGPTDPGTGDPDPILIPSEFHGNWELVDALTDGQNTVKISGLKIEWTGNKKYAADSVGPFYYSEGTRLFDDTDPNRKWLQISDISGNIKVVVAQETIGAAGRTIMTGVFKISE
jgi:hypothetical protein